MKFIQKKRLIYAPQIIDEYRVRETRASCSLLNADRSELVKKKMGKTHADNLTIIQHLYFGQFSVASQFSVHSIRFDRQISIESRA